MALTEAEAFSVCVSVGTAASFGWAAPVVGDPAAANDAKAPLIPLGCVGEALLLIGGATIVGWFVCGVPVNWPNNDPTMLLGFVPAFGADFLFAGKLARGFAWGVEERPLSFLLAVLFELLPNIILHIPPTPCGVSSSGGEQASAIGCVTETRTLGSPGAGVRVVAEAEGALTVGATYCGCDRPGVTVEVE